MLLTQWVEICSLDNINQAFIYEVKKLKPNNRLSYFNIQEAFCIALKDRMDKLDFDFKNYKKMEIVEYNKKRVITLINFSQKVIQRAIMQKIENYFYNLFIPTIYQAIPNRGLSPMSIDIRKILQVNDICFCCKLDIVKYYESINNKILYTKVKNIVKDKLLLRALRKIIFADKGLPLGFLTSQMFGNFYLHKLDKTISILKGISYFRYADDILVISKDRDSLVNAKKLIFVIIDNHQLKVRYTDIVMQDVECVVFCGVKYFKDKILLSKRTYKRFQKNILYFIHYKRWFNVKILFNNLSFY